MDKSAWGPGPWADEPDKIQWQDKATGLPCLIVRNNAGTLCGYVGVAEGHPFYGKSNDEVDVDVHGGLTFAAPCHEEADPARHVCHIAGEGEPEHVYWFGFDCAHAFDLCPAYDRFRSAEYKAAHSGRWREIYRDVRYVKRQVRQLARQLYERRLP